MESSESANQEKISGYCIEPGVSVKCVKLTRQHILDNLPYYEESQSYADIYIICPPAIRELYDEEVLLTKVDHPTRVLVCSTEGGFVHIARHIGPDVVILGQEYLKASEQLRGWLLPGDTDSRMGRANYLREFQPRPVRHCLRWQHCIGQLDDWPKARKCNIAWREILGW